MTSNFNEIPDSVCFIVMVTGSSCRDILHSISQIFYRTVATIHINYLLARQYDGESGYFSTLFLVNIFQVLVQKFVIDENVSWWGVWCLQGFLIAITPHLVDYRRRRLLKYIPPPSHHHLPYYVYLHVKVFAFAFANGHCKCTHHWKLAALRNEDGEIFGWCLN